MNIKVMKRFETLYGGDKSGNIKEWNMQVEDKGDHSIMVYSYGRLKGQKVECTVTIQSGKNKGKKNETTHFQQAVLDAESKWKKKRDTNGYFTDLQAVTATLNKVQASEPLPMLAQDFKKHNKKLIYPCYIQPKLDGYRMLFNPVTSKATSRTGKEYNILKTTQLYESLLRSVVGNPSVCLDGELYLHDADFSFEKYGVLRKQKKENLTPEDKESLSKIRYHVYDLVDTQLTYAERYNKLSSMKLDDGIEIVKTILCHNKDEIDQHHKNFIELGYEGSILRNCNGVYVNKYRSFDLLKRKDFDDGEYKICGFTSEKDTSGNNDDLVVWICETDTGKFNVQSKGSKLERQELYKVANQYIGSNLWVQYFGLTSDGIPRFPKTMRSGKESIRNQIF
jgi:ATP-dependent DNA ligase